MTKLLNQVSHERLLYLLHYDPDTGEFTRKVQMGMAFPPGSKTGQRLSDTGYRHVRIDGVGYKAHRLAWFYVHSVWPDRDIDHINGIRHDNRICNLRPATRSENVLNSKRRCDSKSKYRGVYYHPGSKSPWYARFGNTHVGWFATEEEAHEAYLKRLKESTAEFGELPVHPAYEKLAA